MSCYTDALSQAGDATSYDALVCMTCVHSLPRCDSVDISHLYMHMLFILATGITFSTTIQHRLVHTHSTMDECTQHIQSHDNTCKHDGSDALEKIGRFISWQCLGT